VPTPGAVWAAAPAPCANAGAPLPITTIAMSGKDAVCVAWWVSNVGRHDLNVAGFPPFLKTRIAQSRWRLVV